MKFKIVLPLLVILFIFSACKKDSLPASLDQWNESQVRNLMIGKWKIHYAHNTYPRDTIIYLMNSSWQITPTDTITEIYDNGYYLKEKIGYSKTNYNNKSSWIISGNSPSSIFQYVLEQFKNDTLVAANILFGVKEYMTKQ